MHKDKRPTPHAWSAALIALLSFVILLTAASGSHRADAAAPTSQTPPPSIDAPKLVNMYFRDRSEAILWQELGYDLPEAVVDSDVSGYLAYVPNVPMTPDQYLLARSHNIYVRVVGDVPSSEPDWDPACYRAYDVMLAYLNNLVTQYPNLAQLTDIGDSWCKLNPGQCSYNGFDIWRIKLTNTNIPGPKPKFHVVAAHHAREIATPELALQWIQELVSGYGVNADATWLLDHREIYVVPVENPDGWHRAATDNAYKRKNDHTDNRCSATTWGVDPNRNYDIAWGQPGASSNPCSETYYGYGPNSEPETQSMVAEYTAVQPHSMITLHTYGPYVLYPWGYYPYNQTRPVDVPAYDAIAWNMGRMTNTPRGSVGNEVLYPVSGSTDDWTYDRLGIPSFTVELGGYGDFNMPCSVLPTVVNRYKPMLTYMAKATGILTQTTFMHGFGPSPTNLSANVTGATLDVSAVISANYGTTNGAIYSIDTFPEDGIGTPMALSGQNATASVDVSAFPTGRHTVYVQGKTALNYFGNPDQWGIVSALFFTTTGSITPTVTAAPPTATPGCAQEFAVVSSPGVSGYNNSLSDIEAVSSNDIWAVGNYYTGTSILQSSTLIEHWDGSSWNIVPSPNVQNTSNYLYGISAVAANDIWAVGTAGDSGTPVAPQPLVLHWDGSTWEIVPTPTLGEGRNTLYEVAAISANDVWAVGVRGFSGSGQTLIEHWDGNAWSVVSSPNPGAYTNVLQAVTAVSANDVWAVGYFDTESGGPRYTLAAHWNGTNWTLVSTPNPGANPYSYLGDISAVASNDIWAVGNSQDSSGVQQTLIEHWNGSSWTIVPSPNPPGSNLVNLSGVDATSASDVWAVGYYFSPVASRSETLVEHWNGSEWAIVPSANPGSYANDLYGIYAVSAQDVWTVGSFRQGFPALYQTLVERYTNGCATPSPTVTTTATVPPSSTSISSTNTPPVPGATNTAIPPTATQPPCDIHFDDVPPGHAFYPFIRCLYCRNVVTGYADGTFRPNAQVTRGQLAKIVSNSAGFNEAVSGQTFQDVPSTHTFYVWIERLTIRGHMTGYQCGGPGEPCVSNKPYFRPQANATRGQAAKIVSNAAGFTEPPMGQTFEDVSSAHTFYEFIQRLATRNVMSGYNCGGPAEPCTSGKPYFRPGNDVTRGQSAKIVSNTFFPGCER